VSFTRLSVWRRLIVLPAVFYTLVGCRDDTTSPIRPEPRAVSVTYCAATAPSWVAFKDGDGAWTRTLPEVNGDRTTFRHEFSSDQAAIATATPVFGEFSVLHVLYGAPAELSTEGDTLRAECAASAKTWTGTVAGVDTIDFAAINLGFFLRAAIFPRGDRDFSLEGVQDGPQDLLAARVRAVTDAPNAVRFILRRNLDLPNGGAVPQLDFNSAEAFDAVTRNLTMSDAEVATVGASELVTRNGQFSLPFLAPTSATAPMRPYLAVPESKLEAGDLQVLHVSSSGSADVRSVDEYFRTPLDRDVRFGATLIAPSLSAIGTATTLRLRAHFVPQNDYDRSTSIVYEQPQSSVFVALSMTPSYASVLGGYDIEIPDLTTVPGFDPAWTLRRGMNVTWTAVAVGGTLPLGRTPVPFDGAIRRTAVIQSSLTLP